MLDTLEHDVLIARAQPPRQPGDHELLLALAVGVVIMIAALIV